MTAPETGSWVHQMDSHALALRWEAANPTRCKALCDALDTCANIKAKRALYATFTPDERNGVMPEYSRREENKRAPVGSLVKSASSFGISIHVQGFWRNDSASVSHNGLAIVIGQDGHGGHRRYLMLMPAWQNREGQVVLFGTAASHDLRVIG